MIKSNSRILTITSVGIAAALIACSDNKESKLVKEAEDRLALLGKEEVKKPKPVEDKATATDGNEATAPEILEKAITDGKAAYITCQACHQPTGAGLPSMFPPLLKSDWVNGLSNDELAAIVIRGLSGEIIVNGEKYGNAPMSPLGAVMDDQKIADVLTYVKNSFENDGGYVSPDEVKAVRDASKGKPMLTAADIKGLENLK